MMLSAIGAGMSPYSSYRPFEVPNSSVRQVSPTSPNFGDILIRVLQPSEVADKLRQSVMQADGTVKETGGYQTLYTTIKAVRAVFSHYFQEAQHQQGNAQKTLQELADILHHSSLSMEAIVAQMKELLPPPTGTAPHDSPVALPKDIYDLENGSLVIRWKGKAPDSLLEQLRDALYCSEVSEEHGVQLPEKHTIFTMKRS
jgi:hypothetical protein